MIPTRKLPVALGLAATATLVGCGSAGAPAATPSPPAILSEGPDTGDLLLHGRVLRDGKPAEGAEVAVTAWPVDDDDTGEGEVVDVLDVDSTTSRSDGTWSVELDRADVPQRYLLGDDTVNLELFVVDADLMASWAIPVTRLPDGVWRGSEHVGADGAAVRLDLDLAGGRIVVDDGVNTVREELAPFPKPSDY